MEEFRACFSDLPDPRAANARHDLLEVLFIALAWQTPPCRARLTDLDKPFDDPRGERESAELLQRLLDMKLSKYEPDPIAALAEAEQRQPAK